MLTPTMPYSRPSATRQTRPTSRLKKYAASPYGVSLAILIASSSAVKRAIAATGPKVSSEDMAMSAVTPVRTDGWKNVWPSSWRAPPRTTSAPRSRASATWRSTFSRPGPSMSGPTSTPSSKPEPTRSPATAPVKRSTKAS